MEKEREGTKGMEEVKEVPGSYGWPILGAIRDRLDFFWFQGEKEFWTSRVLKYKSTIFKTNVPPSPPGFSTNSVIMLLDQKSYPILFDNTKVEKSNVLLGSYMPSTSFYGGIRPCIYLDPSDEKHAKIKAFIMYLIKSNMHKWIPESQKAYEAAFPVWEEALAKKKKVGINEEIGQAALKVLVGSIIGRDPTAPGEASLKRLGPFYFQAWTGPQLAPIASAGLPHILEELMLHTLPIPYFLIAFFYHRIERFYTTYGSHVLDIGEEFGLDRNEALHNTIFFMGFNAFGGLNLFLPSLVTFVGLAGSEVQARLAKEVREAIQSEGGVITPKAVKSMELVYSAVYEAFRMAPPVPYQYARAKTDLVIESHDGRYQVKKGDMLGGCLAFASRDPKVFDKPDKYIVDRFVGEKGKKLIRFVLWGNAPADSEATPMNKACAANELVPFLCVLMLANMFLRYDSFSVTEPVVYGNNISYYFTSLNRATT